MSVRNVLLLAALVGFGGVALWDYNSADSKHARELRDLEKLAPDVQVPDCYPRHARAKVFAETVYADRRPQESVPTEPLRRTALAHDCIRGGEKRFDVEHLAEVLGDEGVPLYEQILDRCKVDKLDVSPSACSALDALGKLKSPAATKALEKVLAERKQWKDVWLGALYRLMQTPGWKSRAELAAMVPQEKVWEAKELLIENIREVRDPSARAAIEAAFNAETDLQEKGKLQAALLEIDNPGRCVVEDLGEGEGGICRYVCKDQNQRLRYPRLGKTCPLVRDPMPAAPATAAASVAGAAANQIR